MATISDSQVILPTNSFVDSSLHLGSHPKYVLCLFLFGLFCCSLLLYCLFSGQQCAPSRLSRDQKSVTMCRCESLS